MGHFFNVSPLQPPFPLCYNILNESFNLESVTIMLHLLLGSAKTGKTTEILRQVGENGTKRMQIILIPEQYSHETERRLCREVGSRSAGFCEVLSFTRMANRVFSEVGALNDPILDGGGRILLMHEAVQATAGHLSVYARPSRKPAFLENLLSTADELKSYCVLPEQLLTAGQEQESENAQRLHDLGLILGAYDGLVAERADDPRDRLTKLADRLQDCDYGRGWDFYLDSFTDFTPQQRLVIEKLVKRAHSVTVALTCDTLEQNGSVTRLPTRRTALSLLAMAQESHIPADFRFLDGGRMDGADIPLKALETALFDDSFEEIAETTSSVRLVNADSPYAEVEFAAGEIVRLAREDGLRWREITVAARTMEDYGDLIETIFARYNIPVFLGQMEDILQKPVLTLITAGMDAASGGYEYDDLFRYLKTGLAGVSLEEVDLLENYVLRWDIRGKLWTQAADWSGHPEGYGQKWRSDDREHLKQLNSLRRCIVKPLEALRATPEGTGAELAQVLYAFLEEIELPQRLTDRAAALQERGELQQAEEYRQLWDILCGALEQCAQLMGSAPLKLETFAELFRLVLSQYTVGTIPVALDRVSAGEMQRFAHKETKVLFLLGVDDAHFPLVTQSPGLLTDEDRQLLGEYGCELAPNADQRLDRETAMACDAVTTPSQALILSWSSHGNGGGECRPAAMVERLKKLLPALKVERPADSLRYGAPLPALDAAAQSENEAVLSVLRQHPDWSERTRLMEEATANRRVSLSRPVVNALYGKEVPLSASRMDTIKSCHFTYFMQYGLKAKARKPAGFDAPQVGTFVHYVLENVLKEAKELGGVKQLERKQLKELMTKWVQQYITDELGDLTQQTARFRYLFNRLLNSVELIVMNVADELRHSDFQPISFELGFGKGKDLPPVTLKENGLTISISGFVDRVDGWENNGRLYLRVVDYKTGKKSFSLTDVWHGLEMQMLLYLFTLEDRGKALYGKDIVASGVLYLPARDLILKGSHSMTEEQRLKAADKALERSGMLLDDQTVLNAMEEIEPGGKPRFLPVKVSKKTGEITGDHLATAEQWGKLHKHVQKILRDIAGELAEGNVCADPFLRGDRQTACDWCDYRQCCHFEEGNGQDCYRYLYSVKNKDFFEKQ